MEIVFSHWSDANIGHASLYKEMAAMSNFLAQKCGYNTTLYTDGDGYKFLRKIKYNRIELFDQNTLNSFPSTGWSLGKLYVCSQIQKPFLHIDFDLFLNKRLPEEVLNKNTVFFHQEIWMDPILKSSCRLLKKRPSMISEPQKYRSYNCAIFGGRDYKAFNIAAKNICDFAIENKEFLDKICTQQRQLQTQGKVRYHLYLAMVLEQLWLPQIIINNGGKIDTILNSQDIEKIAEKDNSYLYDNNFLLNGLSKEILEEFQIFVRHLNNKAAQLGTVHYFSKNKDNYREQIINAARNNNLSF